MLSCCVESFHLVVLNRCSRLMLEVQKEALANRVRQRLVALREKELDYYTANCRMLGNQAALVSGFAYSGIRYHQASHSTYIAPLSYRRASTRLTIAPLSYSGWNSKRAGTSRRRRRCSR